MEHGLLGVAAMLLPRIVFASVSVAALGGCSFDLWDDKDKPETVHFDLALMTSPSCAAQACTLPIGSQIATGTTAHVRVTERGFPRDDVDRPYEARSLTPETAAVSMTSACQRVEEILAPSCVGTIIMTTKKAGDVVIEVFHRQTGDVIERATLKVRDPASIDVTAKTAANDSSQSFPIAPSTDGAFEMKLATQLRLDFGARSQDGAELLIGDRTFERTYADSSVVGGSPWTLSDQTKSSSRELVQAHRVGTSTLSVSLSETVSREIVFRVVP